MKKLNHQSICLFTSKRLFTNLKERDMVRKATASVLVGAFVLACGLLESAAQDKDKKERTGTVIGELKSRTVSKNGKSVTLEILGAGEEKARRYLVAYNPNDPKAKAPFEELLAVVNTAKIGDHVQCDWIDTPKGSEGGLFVKAFKSLKKNEPKKGAGK